MYYDMIHKNIIADVAGKQLIKVRNEIKMLLRRSIEPTSNHYQFVPKLIIVKINRRLNSTVMALM